MKTKQWLFAVVLTAVGVGVSASASAQGKGKGGGGPGPQNDCIDCSDETDDTFFGSPADETIDGLGGNDSLYGGGGQDTISGGDDNDEIWAYIDPAFFPNPPTDNSGGRISGGPGDDVLHGDDGSDTLSSEEGDDLMYGHGGDDEIWPFPGHDFIDGGDGRDTIRVNTDLMQFVVNFRSSSVIVPVNGGISVGGDTIRDLMNADGATNTNDVINMEQMRLGTAHADYICGSDNSGPGVWQRDSHTGDGEWFGTGRGNDYISAGAGDDFIGADRGDDILIGGLGSDFLHGAENSDAFVAYASHYTGTENDVIDDFNPSSDTIVLIGLTADAAVPRVGGNDGKGKPDWVVTLRDGGAVAGTITFWDVNPDGNFVNNVQYLNETGIDLSVDFCAVPDD